MNTTNEQESTNMITHDTTRVVTTRREPVPLTTPVIKTKAIDCREERDTIEASRDGGDIRILGHIQKPTERNQRRWFLATSDARAWAKRIIELADNIDAGA